MSLHVTPRPETPTFFLPQEKGRVQEWVNLIGPNYGIQLITSPETMPDQLKGDKVLFTSRCSKTKTGKDKALPNEFYVSPLNIAFYKRVEKYGLRYGILSDLYGIHMDDEYLDFYDIHPTSLTPEQKKELGHKICEKVRQYGYEEVIFYNSSPLMSRPYFEMLYWSELKVYFLTKLEHIDNKYGEPKQKFTKSGKKIVKPALTQTSLFNFGGN